MSTGAGRRQQREHAGDDRPGDQAGGPGRTKDPRRRAYRPVSVPAPALTAANQVSAITVAEGRRAAERHETAGLGAEEGDGVGGAQRHCRDHRDDAGPQQHQGEETGHGI